MATLGLSRLRISAPLKPCAAPALASRPRISLRPPPQQLTHRDAVIVHAGAKSLKNKLRSIRVQEGRRARNTRWKEIYKAHSRAVLRAYAAMLEPEKLTELKEEDDLWEGDELLPKAFSSIDKATKRGLMHKKTAARRKAKLSKARKQVLAVSGIYNPDGWTTFMPGPLVEPKVITYKKKKT